MEASRRKTRTETKKTVRLKRRTKLRKTMAMERLTRWRRRLRATGTSCSTCPRLLPVRNTSSWSSPVTTKSWPHTLMIHFVFLLLPYGLCFPSLLQPTLQPSTTAWKRNWGATLPERPQSRGVEAARLPSSHWGTWVLSLVRGSMTTSQSFTHRKFTSEACWRLRSRKQPSKSVYRFTPVIQDWRKPIQDALQMY